MAIDHADAMILIIDDSPGDLELAIEGIQSSGLESRICSAQGGQAGITFLQSALQSSSDAPDLILLDINMPCINGFDVLTFIREQSLFADLPVFMFSTSIRASDRALAERMGATGYLEKPATFPGYDAVVDRLVPFLPPDGA